MDVFWDIKKIIKKGDYNYCLVPDHPNATAKGYVLHHRVVVENNIGRMLEHNEVVHHINGDKKDNCIENLEIMNAADHNREHSIKGRVCCDLKCPSCGIIFTRELRQTFIKTRRTYTCCSSSCRGKFSRSIQLHGLTDEAKKAMSMNIQRTFNSLTREEVF